MNNVGHSIIIISFFVLNFGIKSIAQEQSTIDPVSVEIIDEVPADGVSIGKVEATTEGNPDRKLSLLMAATNELKKKAAAIGANVLILEGSKKDPVTGNVTLFGNAISVPK